jgi:hypothetical protein
VGGKTRTDSRGEVPQGWDHDPPAKAKLVPFGILTVVSGALLLAFGSRDTSDAWVDALQLWWTQVREGHGPIKRLVIDLDNGCCAPRKLDRCIMEGWVQSEGASTWRSDVNSPRSSRCVWCSTS